MSFEESSMYIPLGFIRELKCLIVIWHSASVANLKLYKLAIFILASVGAA